MGEFAHFYAFHQHNKSTSVILLFNKVCICCTSGLKIVFAGIRTHNLISVMEMFVIFVRASTV